MNDNVFGEWLREELKKQHMTQNELALRIETNGAHISRIVNGKLYPSWTTMKKILEVLKCKIMFMHNDAEEQITEFTIKEITPEEHKEWCKEQIKNHGLYGAVEEQLDEWVGICNQLGYSGFSEATERAQNILDLIEAFGQRFGIYKIEEENHD